MQDTFDSLRPYLETYLLSRGIQPRKRFRCLNPAHLDRDPSMGYDPKRHKVHCFACQADYDLFDLLAIDENLSSPMEALRRASELYGTGNPSASAVSRGGAVLDRAPLIGGEGGGGAAAPAEKRDFFSVSSSVPFLSPEEAALHTGETSYFTERGLSPELVDRFALGYDPHHRCVVLPCAGGAVRRSTEEKRYLNEKGLPSPLFRPELLEGEEPVFLVEGVFDALSIEELGYRACAMNGSGNREKIAQILRGLSKPAPVLLLPDGDRAGEAWSSALLAEFPALYRCPPLPEGKDINEFLLLNKDGASAYLASALSDERAHRPPPYETLSAAGQLEAFHRHIAEQAKRPALETGFPSIDAALDGGLYDGLYVIGAVSSLGKTAFCMQMADQLAQKGRDVLIFTLEMTAYELMARSISRETFLLDTTRGKKLSKTVRGVLDGKRYRFHTPQESAHLETATLRYGTYASHLYFREGDHETGLDYIRKEISRHIAETGVTPVVLIDYLQIIAPVDVHFTDKQNLDRIVCALKKMTREFSATIFAISSFNRENYNLEVSMSAFKESGGIDYSADVLMGLQARGAGSRTFNIDEEKRKDPRELELKILKNRTAALGAPIPLRYYPAYSFFEEG